MTYEELRKQILSNPETKRIYDDYEPQFQIALAIYENRQRKGISQQKLADKTGMDRADISKLENAEANPTLTTLRKIADALGKELIIEFR